MGTGFAPSATGDGCSQGIIADCRTRHGYDQGISVWNSSDITVTGTHARHPAGPDQLLPLQRQRCYRKCLHREHLHACLGPERGLRHRSRGRRPVHSDRECLFLQQLQRDPAEHQPHVRRFRAVAGCLRVAVGRGSVDHPDRLEQQLRQRGQLHHRRPERPHDPGDDLLHRLNRATATISPGLRNSYSSGPTIYARFGSPSRSRATRARCRPCRRESPPTSRSTLRSRRTTAPRTGS